MMKIKLKRFKVIMVNPIDQKWVSELQTLLADLHDIGEVISTYCTEEKKFIEEVQGCDVIIPVGGESRSFLNKKTLLKLKKLKAIITSGVGYDSIDIEMAGKLGISVANTINFCRFEVAEHALALIFSAARQITLFDRVIRSEYKVNLREAAKKIYRLKGKVAGIIGFGRIGQSLSTRLIGCGFQVIAYDYYYDNIKEACKKMKVASVGLHDLLKKSDVISIHVPFTEKTYHMIGENELNMMKKSATLINTSRGEIIDERALFKALKKEKIAFAGLDVFEKEPLSPDNPLTKLNNVILTPHLASTSIESEEERLSEIASNIRRFFTGEELKNIVNYDSFLK